MLIQNSLPDTISSALSLSSERGKRHHMDLECCWSHCDGTWQKSSKYDECGCCSCRNATCGVEEEGKSLSPGTLEFPSTCSDMSTVNKMQDCSSPKRDGYVYKRRKLQRNIVALLSEDNATESTRGSGGYHSTISSEDHPLSVQKDDPERVMMSYLGGCMYDLYKQNPSMPVQSHTQEPATTLSSRTDKTAGLDSVPSFISTNRCSTKKEESADASNNALHKSASENYSGSNDSCSSSKSTIAHASAFNRTEVENGECSSSDAIIVKPVGEFTSAKELCISLLKSHGLFGGACGNSGCASLEVLGDDDPQSFQSCKICGLLENPLKMLICDLCEQAFHVSCCIPKVKKLLVDEWYCQSCYRKRPKPFLDSSCGRPFSDIVEIPEHGDLGPIQLMLRDTRPYRYSARVGYDFQANVPEWSGTISDDYDDYFAEPAKLDPAEFSSLNGRDCHKPSKHNSIGNWIQCREVIYRDSDNNDVGTVCGKWRRAPLFVVQTDDWDCSSSVLWDPIHADCAVPQELETEEVLKHLKYIEMLRPRLAAKKQKPSQRSSDDE